MNVQPESFPFPEIVPVEIELFQEFIPTEVL